MLPTHSFKNILVLQLPNPLTHTLLISVQKFWHLSGFVPVDQVFHWTCGRNSRPASSSYWLGPKSNCAISYEISPFISDMLQSANASITTRISTSRQNVTDNLESKRWVPIEFKDVNIDDELLNDILKEALLPFLNIIHNLWRGEPTLPQRRKSRGTQLP